MEHLLEDLECPVCTDYLTIPIRQCTIGHSVCGKCITKLGQCALCRNEFTESRNITLEGLALKMKYPCINKDTGCTELLSYSDREKHELRCTFRGIRVSCPMKGCDYVGDAASIKSHWLTKKTAKIYNTFNSGSIKLKNDSYFVSLVCAFEEQFWYKTKTFNNTMYFAIQFIGKPEEANKFNFEVEITKSNSSKKKIVLGDYCQSIDLSESELFKEETCCTISFTNLLQFLSNEYLNYTLKVFKIGGAPKTNQNFHNNQNTGTKPKPVHHNKAGNQNVNSGKQHEGFSKSRKGNSEHNSKPKDYKQPSGKKKSAN
ncbi:hypothetical protein HHI36_002978 [Cryptolaemus montrouzieri]|uniref:E3 ubiquitin-protein ligase n=1 Tax=Cryptolaemus montrouzieri TaxID=559131 RepID=A0ABD2PC50_9CUCU